MTFKGSITLPDAGHLEQEYQDLQQLKVWLISCLRMDGDPETLKVTANGLDITNTVGRDLTRHLLADRGGRHG